MFPAALIDVETTTENDLIAHEMPGVGGRYDVPPISGRLLPRYLHASDGPWVEEAMDRLEAAVGLPRQEVERRLLTSPPRLARRRAWRALTRLLLRLHGFSLEACAPPPRLRAALFSAAAESYRRAPGAPRGPILARVAAKLEISPQALEDGLYADRPAERRLRPLEPEPSVSTIIDRYNLTLAQSLLLRSELLRLRIGGHVKAVLREARLRGLLALAETPPHGEGALLWFSGPLSLFAHTNRYGRAMAQFFPLLMHVPGWSLHARCQLHGRIYSWRPDCRDPLRSAHAPPRRFDSKVEAHLFSDLRRVAPEWEVLRESDALQIGRRIISPDFTLVHRARGLRVPVEVMGFWTPDYLRDKLQLLRQLPRAERWLLCVDRSLEIDEQDAVRRRCDLLFYERRVDAEALLARVERMRC